MGCLNLQVGASRFCMNRLRNGKIRLVSFDARDPNCEDEQTHEFTEAEALKLSRQLVIFAFKKGIDNARH